MIVFLQSFSGEYDNAASHGGSHGMNDPFSGGMNDAGLEGPNKVVFNFISACTAEQGISIQELQNKNRSMSEQQLR